MTVISNNSDQKGYLVRKRVFLRWLLLSERLLCFCVYINEMVGVYLYTFGYFLGGF